jgi:hypothetical protein|tara:strand:- start:55 stop:423 length:369 start_codon:yes stop_codon:yes gene_type:complete
MVSLISCTTAATVTIYNKNIPDKIGTEGITPRVIYQNLDFNEILLELPPVGQKSNIIKVKDGESSFFLLFAKEVEGGIAAVRNIQCGAHGDYLLSNHNKLEVTVSYEPGNPGFSGKCDVKIM